MLEQVGICVRQYGSVYSCTVSMAPGVQNLAVLHSTYSVFAVRYCNLAPSYNDTTPDP